MKQLDQKSMSGRMCVNVVVRLASFELCLELGLWLWSASEFYVTVKLCVLYFVLWSLMSLCRP